MQSNQRRKLLIITLLLTLLIVWDTTLGPDAEYWAVRPMRADPPALPPSARPAGSMRVLFIGNSFTRYWGGQVLIGTRMAMSSPAWREKPPIYEQSTANGWDLQEHFGEGRALARIREGNWDYVFLQEHSERPLDDRESFFKYARRFDAEIKKSGAKTVLFMTWAKENEAGKQKALAEAYNALGRELGAAVVPVGLAFQQSLAERPDLRMHDLDGKHPSAAGSYLTACCFYSFLYGRSPTGLQRTIYDRGNEWLAMDEKDALFLQDLAYRVIVGKQEKAP